MPAPGMGFTDWLGRRSGELGHHLSLDLANAGGDQPAACPRLRRHGLGLVRRTRDLDHRGRLHYGTDRGHQHFCAEDRPLAAGPPPHHSLVRASPNRRQSNGPVKKTCTACEIVTPQIQAPSAASGSSTCFRGNQRQAQQNRRRLTPSVTSASSQPGGSLSLATAGWLIVVAPGWLALACLRRVTEYTVGDFLHRTVEIDGVLGRRVGGVGRAVGISRGARSVCPGFVRGVVSRTGVADRHSRKNAASHSRARGKPEKSPALPSTVWLRSTLLLRSRDRKSTRLN